MDYSKEQIEQYFLNLPPDVQDVMSSATVGEELMKIAQKHSLHIDTIDMLYEEVGKIMLGINHPRDFIRNLQKTIGLSPDAARAIAEDINELIFKPIRESLKKVHEASEDATEDQKGVAFGTAGIAVAVTPGGAQQKSSEAQKPAENQPIQPTSARSEFRFGITPVSIPATQKEAASTPPETPQGAMKTIPVVSKPPESTAARVQKEVQPPPNLPMGIPMPTTKHESLVTPNTKPPLPSQSVLRETPEIPRQFTQPRPIEQKKEVSVVPPQPARISVFPKGFGVAAPAALVPKPRQPTVVSEETLKNPDAIEFFKPTTAPTVPVAPKPAQPQTPLAPSTPQFTPQSPQTGNIIGDKLSIPVTAPKEQVEYKVDQAPPDTPQQSSGDPYREPVE